MASSSSPRTAAAPACGWRNGKKDGRHDRAAIQTRYSSIAAGASVAVPLAEFHPMAVHLYSQVIEPEQRREGDDGWTGEHARQNEQWNTEPYAVRRCQGFDEDCDARDEQENGDNPRGDLHAHPSSPVLARRRPLDTASARVISPGCEEVTMRPRSSEPF